MKWPRLIPLLFLLSASVAWAATPTFDGILTPTRTASSLTNTITLTAATGTCASGDLAIVQCFTTTAGAVSFNAPTGTAGCTWTAVGNTLISIAGGSENTYACVLGATDPGKTMICNIGTAETLNSIGICVTAGQVDNSSGCTGSVCANSVQNAASTTTSFPTITGALTATNDLLVFIGGIVGSPTSFGTTWSEGGFITGASGTSTNINAGGSSVWGDFTMTTNGNPTGAQTLITNGASKVSYGTQIALLGPTATPTATPTPTATATPTATPTPKCARPPLGGPEGFGGVFGRTEAGGFAAGCLGNSGSVGPTATPTVTPTPTATPTATPTILAAIAMPTPSPTSCASPTGALPGASCFAGQVTSTQCPSTDAENVFLAVSTPAAAATPNMVIAEHGGLPLATYPFPNTSGLGAFTHDWVANHALVVQIAYTTTIPGHNSNPLITTTPGPYGAMSTVCRAASVMLYLRNTYAIPNSVALDAYGHSEGSAMTLGPALKYGFLKQGFLKHVVVSAASPWGDVVGSCTTNVTPTWLVAGTAYANATQSVRHAPAGVVDAPIGGSPGNFLDSSYGTTSCNGAGGGAGVLPADLTKWQTGSMANPNFGSFDLGSGTMGIFNCAKFNVASGSGVATLSQIAGTSITDIGVNVNGAGGNCNSEVYYGNTGDYTEMLTDMETNG